MHGEEHGLADDILVRPVLDRIANGEERGLLAVPEGNVDPHRHEIGIAKFQRDGTGRDDAGGLVPEEVGGQSLASEETAPTGGPTAHPPHWKDWERTATLAKSSQNRVPP